MTDFGDDPVLGPVLDHFSDPVLDLFLDHFFQQKTIYFYDFKKFMKLKSDQRFPALEEHTHPDENNVLHFFKIF